MFNPFGNLVHNKCKAFQVYNQQVKKLDMTPLHKRRVIESEAKSCKVLIAKSWAC